MPPLFLTLMLSLLSPPAVAEYRVFVLRIEKRSPAGQVVATRETMSVLDPIQYRGYHSVAADETVTYTRTWRCRGRTSDFKAFCPDPRAPAPTDLGPVPAP